VKVAVRARSSLILSCSFGPFLLYYAGEVGEGRELWMRGGGGGGNWLVFNTGRMVFYFIYVVATISI